MPASAAQVRSWTFRKTNWKRFTSLARRGARRGGLCALSSTTGYFPDGAKPLKGMKGVIEIVSDFNKDAYRAVYATKLDERLYVLHVFQKKSKSGIKTPQEELELIKRRLKTAQVIARGSI